MAATHHHHRLLYALLALMAIVIALHLYHVHCMHRLHGLLSAPQAPCDCKARKALGGTHSRVPPGPAAAPMPVKRAPQPDWPTLQAYERSQTTP